MSRVAPGGCPPGAPTDPYVLALEHTVPRITHSHARDERVHAGQGGPAPLSSGFSLTRCPDCDASDVFPSGDLVIRRPASLHAVPRCVSGFPRFSGTIRALRLPATRPAALRFLRLAVPSTRSRRFAPAGPANAWAGGPGLVGVRPARAEMRIGGDGRISQVPGEPPLHLRRALRPRQDHGRLTLRDALARPPWRGRQGLLHCRFRGSIPRLRCSLSTLRPGGRPPGTQDSLPAAGQALPDGL